MSRKVITRFAPSPTGFAHLGSMRTALYNYLFAKKHDGEFLLRIEDTDQSRSVPNAEEYIIESLKWAGIEPTIGFKVNNDGAMYKQSERNALGIYSSYVDQLIQCGKAYIAFDTPEELEAIREASEKTKHPFMYGVFTREKMKNSLTLSAEEVKNKLDSKEPYVVRLKMPRDEEIKFHDLIRGWMSVKSHKIDDKVLFKSDGMPAYHLANVIDDHLMHVTHVIRGEEWLPSAPFHVYLYRCFMEISDWDFIPEFAHLPLILAPNGKKLSKRDGYDSGLPIFPLSHTHPLTRESAIGYKETGYLPAAFNNMLALLGWNPGGNIEVMPMDEMIEKFTLARVGKAGAKFDPMKAKWINGQHLKDFSDNSLLSKMWMEETLGDNIIFKKFVSEKIIHSPFNISDYLNSVVNLLKKKTNTIGDFWANGKYFFENPVLDNTELMSEIELIRHTFLFNFVDDISSIELNEFKHDILKNAFDLNIQKYTKERTDFDARDIGKMLRFIITGQLVGPPIFDILEVLGKEEVLKRLTKENETVLG